jgi:hypothetical protein
LGIFGSASNVYGGQDLSSRLKIREDSWAAKEPGNILGRIKGSRGSILGGMLGGVYGTMIGRGADYQRKQSGIHQPRRAEDSPYKGISDISDMPRYDVQDPSYKAAQMAPVKGYNIGDYGAAKVDPREAHGYDISGPQAQTVDSIKEMQAMNFDPYRRRALQDVEASSASGQATAESNLARSGGLSAADRMAMASQFNRERISGRQGALGKYDEMEARNIYDVDRTNVGAENQRRYANQAAQQQAEMARAQMQTGASRYQASERNRLLGRNQDIMMQQAAAQERSNAYLVGQQNLAQARNMDATNRARMFGAQSGWQNQQARFGSDMDRYKFGKQMEGAERLSTQQWRDAGRKTEMEKAGSVFTGINPFRSDNMWQQGG